MKTLYIECNMGAAGDMLLGALYELLPDMEKDSFLQTINGLFPGQLMLTPSPAEKCGIWGTKMNVVILGQEETPGKDMPLSGKHADSSHPLEQEHVHSHPHAEEHTHHFHTSYPELLAKIDHLSVSEAVKEHAKAVYTLIGNAESLAHNTDISQIHFHEVGSLDALMDVVGCCLLLELLNPEQIIASPVHVGSGSVRCAHGILPVPTPATTEILRDVPIYSGTIEAELCTPTGAAILKHFVSQFTPMPPMTVERTGYGMGTKDFSSANCLRVFLGALSILPVPSSRQRPSTYSSQPPKRPRQEETYPDYYAEHFHSLDQILELSCNLDDMTPEAVAYAVNLLREAGALDVYTTSIYMKKNRPGTLLTVLCNPQEESRFSRLILTHTATRGIRIQPCYRRTLDAQFRKISTVYGEIIVKISTGYGIHKIKPEYEDVATAAKQCKVPFQTVYEAALEACRKKL